MDTFGQKLGVLVRSRRERSGYTRRLLAEEAFDDASKERRIAELEAGQVANPQAKTFGPIVAFLGISDEEILECRDSVHAMSEKVAGSTKEEVETHDPSSIFDESNALSWIEAQSLEVRLTFATRCALRAFPGIGLDPLVLEDRAEVLETLRNLIFSVVGASEPDLFVELLLRRKYHHRPSWLESSVHSAAFSATRAANSSADRLTVRGNARLVHFVFVQSLAVAKDASPQRVYAAAHDPDGTPLVFESERRSAKSTAIAAARADATVLANGDAPTVQDLPLWPYTPPKGVSSALGRVYASWSSDAPTWEFWKYWYQSLLEGKPLDYELMRKIALKLTDNDWAAGPERVAERIRCFRSA